MVPIVVEADDGFEAFASLDATRVEMEAIDVRDGVYRVFDARGARLTLTTHGDEVLISEGENEPADVAALTERIRDYLTRVSARIGEARFVTRFGEVDPKHDPLERLLAVIMRR